MRHLKGCHIVQGFSSSEPAHYIFFGFYTFFLSCCLDLRIYMGYHGSTCFEPVCPETQLWVASNFLTTLLNWIILTKTIPSSSSSSSMIVPTLMSCLSWRTGSQKVVAFLAHRWEHSLNFLNYASGSADLRKPFQSWLLGWVSSKGYITIQIRLLPKTRETTLGRGRHCLRLLHTNI